MVRGIGPARDSLALSYQSIHLALMFSWLVNKCNTSKNVTWFVFSKIPIMSTSTAEPASAPVAPAQETAAPTLSKTPAVGPEVDTPLAKLALELGKLLDDTGHHEVYGVDLQPWTEG